MSIEPTERSAQERPIQRTVPHDRLALLELAPEVGLACDEAASLRSRYGPNEILERSEPAWRALVRETLRDPMLGFLAATALLYALAGQRGEATTLVVAMLPLVAMDAYLHRRTQVSLAGLQSRLIARASVKRGEAWQSLGSTQLVPGDLVHVRSGESIPADGILVGGGSIQVDESALTGEAEPARKHALVSTDEPHAAAPGEAGRSIALDAWAMAGTRLLAGDAFVRVVFTGGETLYGEIVRSGQQMRSQPTALQQGVARLVRALLGVAALLCGLLAVARLQQGFGWSDALVSTLTLAVAALPEEFPVILAVFLGVGVHRLAHRKALVRRAASVENIGRITCVCSDKTGTLTRGELHLTHLEPGSAGAEARLLQRAALAARPDSGDPLDEAILAAARAGSAGADDRDRPLEIAATFPFTEDRRRETRVWRARGTSLLAVTKGAPELVLSLCDLTPSERERLSARVAEWAGEGHKLIACASCELDAIRWSGAEPSASLAFEGLLAFEDPVREGVADAIAQCREAGIQVVMVTGDHRATATAVARQIGLGGSTPRSVSGDELDGFLEHADRKALASVDLVVRALPAQKLALVRAFQAAGEVVAVTGDGVNDVPALQAADVGIAMSERATRPAREAASIVLLDDCFATVVAAIAEGRQLFWNLKLAYRYLLMVHIPLVLTASLIPLAGHPLLFQPVHIVWLELVIHPTALLGFQALPTPGRLAATPRRSGLAILSGREGLAIALGGTILAAVVAFGFVRGLGAGNWIEHGRSFALATLCLASASALAGLSRLRTRAACGVVAGTLAISIGLIETPALAARLHVTPLHTTDWALAGLGGLLALLPLLVEAVLDRSPRRSGSALPPRTAAGRAA